MPCSFRINPDIGDRLRLSSSVPRERAHPRGTVAGLKPDQTGIVSPGWRRGDVSRFFESRDAFLFRTHPQCLMGKLRHAAILTLSGPARRPERCRSRVRPGCVTPARSRHTVLPWWTPAVLQRTILFRQRNTVSDTLFVMFYQLVFHTRRTQSKARAPKTI